MELIPSQGVNPIEDGGHGLWVPLSPPDPPELRPQREPPKNRLLLPQAVQRGRECLQPAAPRHGDVGAISHGPQARLLRSVGCSPCVGELSPMVQPSGTEGFAVLTGPAQQCGLHQVGPCPWDWVPWDP